MIKRIYSDEVNKEFEFDSENGIYVFCGYNSDKCLDEIVNAYKNDYFCLSTGNIKKDGLLLSESDLMIKNLDEFILRVEKSDVTAPVFIFGVFDFGLIFINFTFFSNCLYISFGLKVVLSMRASVKRASQSVIFTTPSAHAYILPSSIKKQRPFCKK